MIGHLLTPTCPHELLIPTSAVTGSILGPNQHSTCHPKLCLLSLCPCLFLFSAAV